MRKLLWGRVAFPQRDDYHLLDYCRSDDCAATDAGYHLGPDMAARAPDSVAPPSDSTPASGVGTYTLDACESAGDDLASQGEHTAAIEEFKRALLLLGGDRGPRRTEL